jgi:putative glycosyltransferase (TIGR04372 family)
MIFSLLIRKAIRITGRLVRKVATGLVIVLYSPLVALLYLARVRFLTGHVYSRIGHLALEPDCFLKTGLLGWRPPYRGILLCLEKDVVNPFFYSCWRDHLTVIYYPILYYAIYPLYCIPFLRLPSGKESHKGKGVKSGIVPAVYSIARAYHKEFGGKPLFSLPKAQIERGWRELYELGVSEGAWFVCLHVREAGYLPELEYHSYRDADIMTYIPAIEEIVGRGGWVVRIGDATMKPLPEMDHVIDLTRADLGRDGSDIFCLTQCRFVLGTTSGPVAVSYIAGVPSALTNWTPMGNGAFSHRDMWIPKLYWLRAENRYLTFEEVLSKPHRFYGRADQFDNDGISLVDNSAEEIALLCREMMDKLESQLDYTLEDDRMQERFQELLAFESDDWSTEAKVGRGFLRKNKNLFACL